MITVRTKDGRAGKTLGHYSGETELEIFQQMKKEGSMFTLSMSDHAYIDWVAMQARENFGIRTVLEGTSAADRARELLARMVQAGLIERLEE